MAASNASHWHCMSTRLLSQRVAPCRRITAAANPRAVVLVPQQLALRRTFGLDSKGPRFDVQGFDRPSALQCRTDALKASRTIRPTFGYHFSAQRSVSEKVSTPSTASSPPQEKSSTRSNDSIPGEHQSDSRSASSSTPVSRGLDAARQRTTDLSNKVRSSLNKLTPHENIYNLPNFLTVTRLVAAPATAYLLLHDQHTWALALFAYAGITDLVDGWMARKWKLQTVAGSVIDPMADKALMIILTLTLAVKGAIPVYLATLIFGRDASLAIAALYYRYASLPAPKTMLRYWDFSLPSAEVHPTTVSKYNTFLQLILIGSTLALPVVTAGGQASDTLQSFGMDAAQLHTVMTYFQYVVAATTVWSGMSYAVLKNAVTIIGTNEKLKAKQGARGRAIIGVTFGGLVLFAAWSAAFRDGVEVDRDDKQSKTP